MASSSAAEKGRCWILGLSWLHHLRRQDFPERPAMYLLMRDQFRAPCRSTKRVRIRSSSALHGPLILSDLLCFVLAPDNDDVSEDVSDDDELPDEMSILEILERERERENCKLEVSFGFG